MQKQRNDLKAGIFIVLSAILIVVIVISIKGIGRMLEPSQVRTATFKLTDDVGGLRRGDDVRIGGFKVGVVRNIEIVSPAGEQPLLVVEFSVPARFRIHSDARLGVQSTLTGTSWLNFDSLGSPDAPLLAQGQSLTGRAGMFSTLLASAGELAPDIRDTIRDVRAVTIPKANDTLDTYKTTGAHATALIKHIRSRIEPIVERYYAVADAARQAAQNIGEVFGETKGDFKSTMSNISTVSGTVKEKLPGILERLDSGLTKAQTAIDNANVALEDVKKIAADGKEISASVRSIIVGNRGRIESIIASIKQTGDNVKYGTAELRRSPWRLLYRPPPGEVANLNLYDTARQFAEGAGQLNDAATSLRDALQDAQATPEQIQLLLGKLDETFSNFSRIEQELWKQVK